MSTDAATPLRQRMIEDMNARKLGAHSQRSHISSCRRFAAFLKRSPDTAAPDDVRRFQLHLAETGMSICNRNRIMTGVKFLFRVTFGGTDLMQLTVRNQIEVDRQTGRLRGRVNSSSPERPAVPATRHRTTPSQSSPTRTLSAASAPN
jgi:hypothetical protein